MQYIDSSALVKRYVVEPQSEEAARLLEVDPGWVCAAHTEVEVRRTLTVRLRHQPPLLAKVRKVFASDWQRVAVVQLDAETCRIAAELAEVTQARTLDALHLAAAQRAGAPGLRIVTFDIRMAAAARGLGWSVAGA